MICISGLAVAGPADSVKVVFNDSINFNYDSLSKIPPSYLLTPDYYETRYGEKDLMYKIVDNWGNGFDSLYGTRNVRPILHGVAYRGGANNFFHKTGKRKNQNPLPNDGVRNLCREGFSNSIYLYRKDFETAPAADSCGCVNETANVMDYHQLNYYDSVHVYKMLEMVYKSAINDSVGPVYLHCWNGWHASGFISAVILKQFCGYSSWDAVNYWDIGTDGANKSPRYQKQRERIKNFEPYPEFMIKDNLGNTLCPPMPEFIDSTELHIEVEHLLIVPESIPVGYDIVLYNVKFGAGKSTFSNPGSNKDVKNLLGALQKQKDLKVEIGGYTDKSGGYAANVSISANRAKFIYDYLVKKGIDTSRISYKGYGPKKPLYSNKYKSTRSGNRRIEVKILSKKEHSGDRLVDEDGDGISEKKSNELYHLKYLKDSISIFEIGKTIIIDSMIFEPNSTIVPEKSFGQLEMIVAAMKVNKTMKLEISGHTDRSGLDSLNIRLSNERAASVYNYLVIKGADQKRLSHQGYGSAIPIASNKYKWGRDKNRRVELKIMAK
jgi:outer membrane protein OmpA-like peptidoglycan-associated protein